MREFNIKAELDSVKSFRDKFDKLTAQGKLVKAALIAYLNSGEVNLTTITEDEIIKFQFLGLPFRIKIESLWTNESPMFRIGELNIYLVQNELKENELENLIISYNFDSMGNVNNYHTVNEFPKFFYRDFVDSLITYCKDNSIKFILK